MPKFEFKMWIEADDDGTVTDLQWEQVESKPRIKVLRRGLTREVRDWVEQYSRSDEDAQRFRDYLRECVRLGLRVAKPGSGARGYINVWHTDDRNYRAACLTLGTGLLHFPYATEAMPVGQWKAMPGVNAVLNNGEETSGVKMYLREDESVEQAIEMTKLIKNTRWKQPA